MIDYLREIIAYTYKLGFINTVKVTGSKTATHLDAMADDQSVVLKSTFNTTIHEFNGVFGLPNLDKLDTILNISEYKEDATLSVGTILKENIAKPANIKFENKAGDFQNEYRLMSEDVINSILQNRKFTSPKWDITVTPSITSIQRLKFQAAAAGSDETSFVAKTENGDLKFYIGDHSTHAGHFVFEHKVQGNLKANRNWPLKQVMAILSLNGDKTMQISDQGAMLITIMSGLCTHEYIILALTK